MTDPDPSSPKIPDAVAQDCARLILDLDGMAAKGDDSILTKQLRAVFKTNYEPLLEKNRDFKAKVRQIIKDLESSEGGPPGSGPSDDLGLWIICLSPTEQPGVM